MDDPDVIIHLIGRYPEFKALYEHIFDICRNVEDIMGLFSEELLEMDRNTVKYMVDEMQETIEEQKNTLEKQKSALEKQKEALEKQKSALKKQQTILDEKDDTIEKLKEENDKLQAELEDLRKMQREHARKI